MASFTKAYPDTIETCPRPIPSPPSPALGRALSENPTRELSSDSWKPHFLATLQPFQKPKVPGVESMVSFHPEFLHKQLDGRAWSSGLYYITRSSACMLKNRSYYLLDPKTDPYLPDQPGHHGAKLAAFFNQSPEAVSGGLPKGSTSYEDAPLFVLHNGRYTYYGNYSQTRRSDKADHDTMKTRIPQNVKDHWAKKLTSVLRPAWVAEELKKHFFKKPEYQGSLYPSHPDDGALNPDREAKIQNELAMDVNKYVQQLREWEREAEIKTARITPQFILDAFETADSDDLPALRLWWDYLECVDWRKDFYDSLVTLQSCNPRYKLQG